MDMKQIYRIREFVQNFFNTSTFYVICVLICHPSLIILISVSVAVCLARTKTIAWMYDVWNITSEYLRCLK